MCRPNLYFVLTVVIAVGGTVCEDKESPISRDHELSYCTDYVSAIDLLANDGHTKASNVIREEVYERPVDDTVTCMAAIQFHFWLLLLLLLLLLGLQRRQLQTGLGSPSRLGRRLS
jgi:hypothetical protein